jgi:hypothetical protein
MSSNFDDYSASGHPDERQNNRNGEPKHAPHGFPPVYYNTPPMRHHGKSRYQRHTDRKEQNRLSPHSEMQLPPCQEPVFHLK